MNNLDIFTSNKFTVVLTQFSRGLSYLSTKSNEYKIQDNKYQIMNILSPENLSKLKSEGFDIKRLLISTGISFKFQLSKYGGDGYESIYDYLEENGITYTPDLSIFEFWTKPAIEEEEVPTFT